MFPYFKYSCFYQYYLTITEVYTCYLYSLILVVEILKKIKLNIKNTKQRARKGVPMPQPPVLVSTVRTDKTE